MTRSSADRATAQSRASPTKSASGNNWAALAIVSVGIFLGTIDNSIVNVSLPILAEALSTDATMVAWVILAFFLASTSLLLTLGRIGDSLGRKRVYATGFLVYTIAIGLSSLAQNVGQLIAFRAIQGVGTAMIVANGVAIVTAAFPANERGKVLGIIGGVVGAGLTTGPLLGGILLYALDWRAIFYARIPVCLAELLAATLVLPDDRPRIRQALDFDILGTITLFLTIAPFLLAVNQAPRLGLTAPLLWTLLSVSLAFLALFLYVESRARSPILALKLFRDTTFAGANISNFLYFVAYASLTFLVPFLLIRGMGYPPITAGIIVTTVPLMRIVFAPVAGLLSDRIGSSIPWAAGLFLMAAGLAALRVQTASAGLSDIVWRLMVVGTGAALFEPSNKSVIMGSAPRERLGTASAVLALGRQIGQSMGLTVASAVFVARQTWYEAALARSGDLAHAASQAVVPGFQDAILVAASAAGLGILPLFLRPRRSQLDARRSGDPAL